MWAGNLSPNDPPSHTAHSAWESPGACCGVGRVWGLRVGGLRSATTLGALTAFCSDGWRDRSDGEPTLLVMGVDNCLANLVSLAVLLTHAHKPRTPLPRHARSHRRPLGRVARATHRRTCGYRRRVGVGGVSRRPHRLARVVHDRSRLRRVVRRVD